MRLGGGGDGVEVLPPGEDLVSLGEDFYDVMLEALGQLAPATQLEIAGAFQSALAGAKTPFAELSEEARQVFEAVAEAVRSDEDDEDGEG